MMYIISNIKFTKPLLAKTRPSDIHWVRGGPDCAINQFLPDLRPQFSHRWGIGQRAMDFLLFRLTRDQTYPPRAMRGPVPDIWRVTASQYFYNCFIARLAHRYLGYPNTDYVRSIFVQWNSLSGIVHQWNHPIYGFDLLPYFSLLRHQPYSEYLSTAYSPTVLKRFKVVKFGT